MPARFILPEDIAHQEPAYLMPYGPTWQYRAGEILEDVQIDHVRYVVRRLTSAPGLLITGAVLQHAANLEHPRLYGPNFWTREGDALWLATVRPLGIPLWRSDIGGLPFNKAVTLWRPLAEAVARAHQRGIVHGQLTPWTVWYDGEAERLTAIDAGCWVGDEAGPEEELTWWAPEFRTTPRGRKPTPLVDIYGLARLLVALTTPLDTPAGTLRFDHLPSFAQPALERALRDDPAARLNRVEELLDATAPTQMERYDPQLVDAQGEEIVSVLAARISHQERFNHPRLGAGMKFMLNTMESDGSEGQVGAFFYDAMDSSLYHSVRWGWDGAQLNLLDARVVTDSRGRRFVTSHSETLPILEPTFPIAVSDVLKAERCTSRFLVDQRDGGGSSRALVLGNLVHGLLEDLTSPAPPTFAQAFDQRARALRLDMLAAGLADAELETLARDARQHFDNLQRFTRQEPAPADAPGALAPGASVSLAPSPRWPQDSVYQADASAPRSWSGRHIEATRYSPLYGLEGRIDLATEDERDGLQIIELKSGSAWDGHLSQVRCYTLLWDGLARQRGLPMRGFVLYSRYGRLNAVPMDDISRERRILRARNELLACHRSFVDPTSPYTPPHFMQEPRNCNAPSCKFRRDRCKEQTEVLGLDPHDTALRASAPGGAWDGIAPELVSRAWAYWRHFTRLVEMEHWAQNSAMGAIFQPGRLGERLANHRAVTGMRITQVTLSTREITFEGRGAQIFSRGSSVLAHRGDLHGGHTLQGEVIEASPERIVVRSQGAPIASSLEQASWIIDLLPTRLGVRQSKRAMYGLLRRKDARLLTALLMSHTPEARALFDAPQALAAQPPELPLADVPIASINNRSPQLNDTQRRALRLALEAPCGAIIQGPPGTGKTTVIAQIVRELVLRGQRVLVTAQTNTAVDTILAKVIDAGVRTFLRVGTAKRSRELAAALDMAGADPALYFTQELAEQAVDLEELANALRTCPVYGATTHATVGAAPFEYLERTLGERPFDVVIVDEASQLTEPMTIAALLRGARFVLVGDHRQLPPIVQSEQALSVFFDPNATLSRAPDLLAAREERGDDDEARVSAPSFEVEPALQEIGVAGLDRSLFERLIGQLPHVMLEEQYRMSADIMTYSNRAYYHARLKAHPDIAGQHLAMSGADNPELSEALREVLAPERPLVFVDVPGADSGRANRAEAEALVQTLRALIGPAGLRADQSIGVISPFRAQVQLIQSLLREALGEDARAIDVDTVERYQGGERDVILVSLVKTERAGDFLADDRRLNVTLTRARRKLVLFGHRDCLILNPTYRALIEQPETHLTRWPMRDDAR